MKYKLINITTKQETLCDKVTIDGFDYYVSDEEIKKQDKFYSYLIFEDEEGEETQSFGIYTCLSNNKSKYENHITSIETGRNGDITKHFIFETETCKLVIATNNPNIDIPKVVDEVEELALKTTLHPEVLFDELKKCSQNDALLMDEFGDYNIIRYRETTGFILGYNKSQETHPFSTKDMIEFADWIIDQDWSKIDMSCIFPKLESTGKSTKELLQLWQEQQPKKVYYNE